MLCNAVISKCVYVEFLLCRIFTVLFYSIVVELHNSQVVLKGVETDGHVIVSAAKAEIMSYEYQPVWQNQQVHSKTAWVSSIECMQVSRNFSTACK